MRSARQENNPPVLHSSFFILHSSLGQGSHPDGKYGRASANAISAAPTVTASTESVTLNQPLPRFSAATGSGGGAGRFGAGAGAGRGAGGCGFGGAGVSPSGISRIACGCGAGAGRGGDDGA